MSFYESTNVTCRAKSYLLTYVILKQQNDFLISFIQSKFDFNIKKKKNFKILKILKFKRLVNSVERDHRKTFPVKEENDYMHRVIDLLSELLLQISSTILGKIKDYMETWLIFIIWI